MFFQCNIIPTLFIGGSLAAMIFDQHQHMHMVSGIQLDQKQINRNIHVLLHIYIRTLLLFCLIGNKKPQFFQTIHWVKLRKVFTCQCYCYLRETQFFGIITRLPFILHDNFFVFYLQLYVSYIPNYLVFHSIYKKNGDFQVPIMSPPPNFYANSASGLYRSLSHYGHR